RQLALADNAEEIRGLAEELYGRLTAFIGHVNKLGRQLGSSVESYNRAVGSLERKVLPGARKFVELGIRPKKIMEQTEVLESLPRELADESNDTDEIDQQGTGGVANSGNG
ncbi:MAG: DNA recombination protein RmuC, partial [Woeseiaceae bacterium]